MRYLFKFILLNAVLSLTIAFSAVIEKGNLNIDSGLSSFRVKMFGYSDSMFYKSSLTPDQNELFRHSTISDMGIAFYPPPHVENAAADSAEMYFIEYYTPVYLKANYYDKAIFKYTKSYWLKDFQRKEFYFDIISNGVPMRFSGWYGHCIHIIVFTDFENETGFMEKINEFFNLTKLNIENISYNADANFPNDFFFSYRDIDKQIKVYGYPLLLPNEHKEIEKISGDYNTALELFINIKEGQNEK